MRLNLVTSRMYIPENEDHARNAILLEHNIENKSTTQLNIKKTG